MQNQQYINILRNSRGATIVEFAVVAPLFFMVFLGMIGWSFVMMSVNGIQFASEQAVRCKIVTNCISGATYNSPATQRIDWLPSLSSGSYTLTPNAPTSLPAVYCVEVNIVNRFIPGFASLPNFLKKNYCRSTQIRD